MELHQLRYFVAVAEAGTASRAAARCHVAQPSLSQQIRKLELGLGKRLFDRLGRGMMLTEAGRSFLPRAKRILAEVRDAEAWAGREEEGGLTLRVGAIPTIAPYLLPAALARTRKALPACEITVREDLTDHLAEAIIDCEIDCAVMSTPPEDDRLSGEVIGAEELLAVVPSSWEVTPRGLVSLADLRDQPAVLLEEVHCLGQQVETICSLRKLAPRVVCRTTQLSTILEMVALGLGYSLIPEMAMSAERRSSLRSAHLSAARPTRPIVFVTRSGRERGRATRTILESLRRGLTPASKAGG